MSHHYSTTAIIRCSDDRYRKGRELFDVYQNILRVEKIDANDPYKIFVLGAGIDFQVDPESKTLKHMVKALTKLGIKKVVLIEHTPGCGAYAVDFGELSEEEERTLHLKSIEATKKFFLEHLPQIELVCYLQSNNINYKKII